MSMEVGININLNRSRSATVDLAVDWWPSKHIGALHDNHFF